MMNIIFDGWGFVGMGCFFILGCTLGLGAMYIFDTPNFSTKPLWFACGVLLATISTALCYVRSHEYHMAYYWCADHGGVEYVFPPTNTFMCGDGSKIELEVHVTSLR